MPNHRNIDEISYLFENDINVYHEELKKLLEFTDKVKMISDNSLSWSSSFYYTIISNIYSNMKQIKESNNSNYFDKILKLMLEIYAILLTNNKSYPSIKNNERIKSIHYSIWTMIIKNNEIIDSMVQLGVPKNFFYNN